MRTLNPAVVGIAYCAFALNCSGQAVSQSVSSGVSHTSSVSTADDYAFNAQSHGNSPLPDSPGSTVAALQAPAQQSNSAQSSDSTAPAPGQAAPQRPQHPVGTAAAEAPKVSGITAAQPAGVAIAPAKQRRVRTIVLRVGAIIGAGVALGTVIALTEGTSSKPPGAH